MHRISVVHLKPYGKLFIHSFLNSNSNSNSHTNHGVVTCTDKSHHFNMSGNGGGTCELCIGVHSSESICHTVGSGACCHVIGMESSTCAATGSNGEVLNAILVTPLLVWSA